MGDGMVELLSPPQSCGGPAADSAELILMSRRLARSGSTLEAHERAVSGVLPTWLGHDFRCELYRDLWSP